MKLSQQLKSSAVVLLVGAGLLLAGASGAFAQSPAPTKPAATAATPADKASPDKKAAADKKAISKECSDQATSKGLHGKERKAFRSECKRNGGKPA
jgi:hypothetical protein